MVNDISIGISLRNMDEMIPVHHALLRFGNFVCIGCKHLLIVEFEFHIFIIKHLAEDGALK